MASAELKEIAVSVSLGGKVQIVKFEFSQDYHYSMSAKWDVEGFTVEEAAEFREAQIEELRNHLEIIAQKEVDQLMEQRDSQ